MTAAGVLGEDRRSIHRVAYGQQLYRARKEKINDSCDANPGFTRGATGRDVTLSTHSVHSPVVDQA